MSLAPTTETEVVPVGLEPVDWLVAAGVFVAVLVATWFARRLAERVGGRLGLEPGTARPLARFVAAIVFLAGTVYVLSTLGIAIGPLLGALGVGGLALAFALQDIVENLIAGIMLQARRPFSLGDEVVVGEHAGIVRDVNLRATVLRTFDGRDVIVPSSTVLKNPIENTMALDRRRTTLTVGVTYEADLDDVRSLLVAAARGADGVLDRPAPDAWVEAFGPSAVDVAVVFWHGSAIADEWEARHAVAVAVKGALDSAGVDIPFPIRTVDVSFERER